MKAKFTQREQMAYSTIAKLEAERDQLKAENDTLKAAAMGIRDAWREDQAKLEALRKDAERYRWLRDKQTFIWLIQDWFPGEAMLTNVDADIDAAMAKEASR